MVVVSSFRGKADRTKERPVTRMSLGAFVCGDSIQRRRFVLPGLA